MSSSSTKRGPPPRPTAPSYQSNKLGALIDHGPPPLDTRSAKRLSSAHTNPVVPKPARIVVQKDCPPPQLPSLLRVPEDIRDIPSDVLRVGLGMRYILTYESEADVQGFVQRLLNDAIAVIGAVYDCITRLELSVFYLRPDIIVVSYRESGIILVVEVKKPDKPGKESVFVSRKVGGQVYDYLMGMHHMGNATPFGILSTYEYMTIAWLDTPRSNEIMGELIHLLSSAPILEQESKEDEANITTKRPRPLKTERAVPSQVAAPGAQHLSPNEEVEDDFERKIMYSHKCKYDQALKATVLALRCGFVTAKESSQRKIPKQRGYSGNLCSLSSRRCFLEEHFKNHDRLRFFSCSAH